MAAGGLVPHVVEGLDCGQSRRHASWVIVLAAFGCPSRARASQKQRGAGQLLGARLWRGTEFAQTSGVLSAAKLELNHNKHTATYGYMRSYEK